MPEERGAAALELDHRLIEAIPGGIVHVGADGSIQCANAEALHVLGMSYDAITRRYTSDWEPVTMWEDGSPCRAEDYPVTRALVTGEPQPRATIGIRRPDGTVSWAIFTAMPVKDPDTGAVTGAVVTFLDITERKRLESRLRMSDRMATVGILAAGVAHEINNPLTYVMANLDMVARTVGDGDPRLATRLHEAMEGARRIRAVVHDLGVFSHADDGVATPTDVHEVLEFCARMLRNELHHRATLVRDYDGELPLIVADASRLAQVFLNVLANAVQAIAPGEARRQRIELRTRRAGDGGVEVTIADTGGGIPRDVIEHLSAPVGSPGLGLGLYMSHSIVTGLGGELTIESEPGRGTRVTVTLPPGGLHHRAGTPRPVAAAAPRARILVVDDEPAIRRCLADLLEDHDVVAVGSGRDAIAALDAGDFDLVVCDLLMPELTGMDVYGHARRQHPELVDRFVFMTGAACSAPVRQFLRETPGAVLEKPFRAPDVARVVTGLLTGADGRFASPP